MARGGEGNGRGEGGGNGTEGKEREREKVWERRGEGGDTPYFFAWNDAYGSFLRPVVYSDTKRRRVELYRRSDLTKQLDAESPNNAVTDQF